MLTPESSIAFFVIGNAAPLDAVEKVTAATFANLLINGAILSPVNPFNNPEYTTTACTAKANSTTIIYFIKDPKASNPVVAKVLAINPNTPIGAIAITILTIFKQTSFKLSIKFFTCLAFSPNMLIVAPNKIEKDIIWSISPSTIALTGFVGLIIKSAILWLSPIVGSWITKLDISNPTPGLIRNPRPIAIDIATAVVNK